MTHPPVDSSVDTLWFDSRLVKRNLEEQLKKSIKSLKRVQQRGSTQRYTRAQLRVAPFISLDNGVNPPRAEGGDAPTKKPIKASLGESLPSTGSNPSTGSWVIVDSYNVGLTNKRVRVSERPKLDAKKRSKLDILRSEVFSALDRYERRNGLGMLPAGWYKQMRDCAPGRYCGGRYCDLCAARSVRLMLSTVDAFMKITGADADLLTMTRATYCRTTEDIVRFLQACRMFGDYLRFLGVEGLASVVEVKLKYDDMTGVMCCLEPEGCPLCMGFGYLPAAHVHVHAVAIKSPSLWLPYKWLHNIGGPSLLDSDMGNFDYKEAREFRKNALRYLIPYLAELKQNGQKAYLRRMLGKARMGWKTGVLRGTVDMAKYHTTAVGSAGVVTAYRKEWVLHAQNLKEVKTQIDLYQKYRDHKKKLEQWGLQTVSGVHIIERDLDELVLHY